MNYWIHRCAYVGGHEILDNESLEVPQFLRQENRRALENKG